MQMILPWHRTLTGHSDKLLFTLNILDGQVYARSAECYRVTQLGFPYCLPCTGLEAKVAQLGDAWPSYQPGTHRSLQNMVQLSLAIDHRDQNLNKWKLKVTNSFH